MSNDAIDPNELQALRDQAAALLRRWRKLKREKPPCLSQEEVAAKLGISRWDVRKHEARGLIKARRTARKILLTQPQP